MKHHITKKTNRIFMAACFAAMAVGTASAQGTGLDLSTPMDSVTASITDAAGQILSTIGPLLLPVVGIVAFISAVRFGIKWMKGALR